MALNWFTHQHQVCAVGGWKIYDSHSNIGERIIASPSIISFIVRALSYQTSTSSISKCLSGANVSPSPQFGRRVISDGCGAESGNWPRTSPRIRRLSVSNVGIAAGNHLSSFVAVLLISWWLIGRPGTHLFTHHFYCWLRRCSNLGKQDNVFLLWKTVVKYPLSRNFTLRESNETFKHLIASFAWINPHCLRLITLQTHNKKRWD